MAELSGQAIIVTGASRGIGRAIAGKAASAAARRHFGRIDFDQNATGAI